MESLIHADIFFFVATIGLIIFIALGTVGMVMMLGIMKKIHRISTKLEAGLENISAEARGFIEDIRESSMYRFIFRKRRSK